MVQGHSGFIPILSLVNNEITGVVGTGHVRSSVQRQAELESLLAV